MINDLFRVRAAPVGIRRDDDAPDDAIGTLYGHAIRFNEWTEIDSPWEGHFLERMAPGCAKKTLTENRQSIRCLFRHGYDPQIGDKVLGAFSELREDKDGVFYEVPLYDTSYNRDLAPGFRDEQYGASFRAKVIKEQVDKKPARSTRNPGGIPERTITEIAIRELGPCTFGAYPGASSAMRSSLDDVLSSVMKDPTALARFAERFDLDTLTAGAVGAVNPQDTEPVRHSGQHNDHARLQLMLHQAGI
jgi:HK97 family phage prohead protease